MKFLFDLLPIFLFFVAYKFGDIWIATGVAIAASLCQIAWLLLRRKKIDAMLWLSLAIIVVMGSATLILHDETFIKWKPTVVYWAFSLVLLVAEFAFGRNLIRSVQKEIMQLPEPVWRNVLLSWIVFFAVMGGANLYVAFNYPTETWVNFKFFGFTAMMFVFVIAQALMLAKYVETGPDK
jgi:intracellular septation protein